MRLTHLLLVSVLLLPIPASGQLPREEPVPPRVSRYAEQVWTDLIDTLDVDALLRPSCVEVAANARRYPGDFPHLDKNLQLTDAEVCEFVIDATTLAFQLFVRLYAFHSVESVEAMAEDENGAAINVVVNDFFPGRRLRLADALVDENGQPVFEHLHTRNEVIRFHELMKTFRGLRAQGVQWKTPQLEAFGQWFAAEQTDATVIERMPDGLYKQCRYGWCLQIDDSGPQPKVTELGLFTQ